MDATEVALSAGQPFCIARVDVGLDATALREAVVKCMNRLPTMLFSTDVASNKTVVYAGVPPGASNGLEVLDWLTRSVKPLKGRGGGGKNGLAQGQVSPLFSRSFILFVPSFVRSIFVSGQGLLIKKICKFCNAGK
jgi:alanyl-tRNA synthetase